MLFISYFWFGCLVFNVSFFFFKQKTAYEMRSSDWSSDVCSSDLITVGADHLGDRNGRDQARTRRPDRRPRRPARLAQSWAGACENAVRQHRCRAGGGRGDGRLVVEPDEGRRFVERLARR